ncbi:class I SAM-dependent methyltransferase [Capilliphycus salinus ALCB114379]|uniref:class I SAM-dependent methyltransferase n=1 Tax=Capilliphycus salinus TaxID=2768948 RepID=UPI0039A6752A
MTQFYSEDLAYIHDVGFGELAENSASFLLNLLQQQEQKKGLIVDLGCGSGILAQQLYRAGYEVFGIDISGDLIAIACQRVPRAKFHVESIFTANIPACIAVTAIGECLNYLFDENNTKTQRFNLFQRVYEALDVGGLFLFDIAEPGRVFGEESYRNFRQTEDWAVLVYGEENQQQKRLTRWITTFRKVWRTLSMDN